MLFPIIANKVLIKNKSFAIPTCFSADLTYDSQGTFEINGVQYPITINQIAREFVPGATILPSAYGYRARAKTDLHEIIKGIFAHSSKAIENGETPEISESMDVEATVENGNISFKVVNINRAADNGESIAS